jgi:hypothetical protein
MKKTILVFIVFGLLGILVSAKTNEENDSNSIEVKPQGDNLIATPVHQQFDKLVTAKVSPEAIKEIPVKVEVNISKPLEVELTLRHNDGMSVKDEGQTSKGFPVRVERDYFYSMLSILTAFATIAIAIFTFLTAKTARKSARISQQSVEAVKSVAEGRLLFELMTKYASKRMRDDVRTLCEWGSNLSNDKLNEKAKQWIDDLNLSKEEADKVDLARRHVTYFLDTVVRMQKPGGYVRETFVKTILEGMSEKVVNILLALGEALIRNTGEKNKDESEKVEKRIMRLRMRLEDIKTMIDAGN